jgi:hypothetical protein
MSKELIKEAIGLRPEGHIYDMRPRYDVDTYIEILRISKETGIKPNVVIRIATKLMFGEMREQGRDAVIKAIMRAQSKD